MPAIRPVAALVILLILPLRAWSQVRPPKPAPAQDPAAAAARRRGPAPTVGCPRRPTCLPTRSSSSGTAPRIAAQIEQTVDMLNQKFELKGFYFKDTGNRVRLQLDLQGAGENGSTMLQVCDGKVLWEYQKVVGMKNYRKREIVPILKKLEDPGLDDDFRIQVMTQLGFGGPEALLSGFQKAIAFDQFADTRSSTGRPELRPRGQVEGSDRLVRTQRPPLAPTDPLPPYIPSEHPDLRRQGARLAVSGRDDRQPTVDDRRRYPEVDKSHRPDRSGRPAAAQGRPRPRSPCRTPCCPESEIKPDEQFVFSDSPRRHQPDRRDRDVPRRPRPGDPVQAQREEGQGSRERGGRRAADQGPAVDIPTPGPPIAPGSPAAPK